MVQAALNPLEGTLWSFWPLGDWWGNVEQVMYVHVGDDINSYKAHKAVMQMCSVQKHCFAMDWQVVAVRQQETEHVLGKDREREEKKMQKN